MKQKIGVLLLGFFLLIGFGLRFYKLTDVPQGINWDEAANGYNAYSLLKTGKDEFGKPWPLFTESFGEYKSGLGIIVLVPMIKALGLSIFAVRLPTVIFGCLLILASFYLALQVFKKIIPASLVAGLIAISPWAIHTSRFSLEWYLGFPLMVFGSALLIDQARDNWKIPVATVFLSGSLYFYSNIKFFLPLILLSYLLVYRKSLKKKFKVILACSILGLLLLMPLYKAMNQTDWLARARKVSLVTNENLLLDLKEGLYHHSVSNLPLIRLFNNKPLFFGKEFVNRYLGHFSTEFLFMGKDATPRLEISRTGKMYLISLPFLIWGLALAIKRRSKEDMFLLAWLGLAPIASSLTIDSPHGLRAIIMMPILQIFIVMGLMAGYKLLEKKQALFRVIGVIAVVIIYLGSLSYFLWRYFLFYPEETASAWLDGHKEVVEKIEKHRLGFDQIIFNVSQGQPHIFFAFFGKIDPVTYQLEAVGQQNIFNAYLTHLNGVEFREFNKDVDFCVENALIIDEPGRMKSVPRLDQVYISNRFHEPKLVFEMFDTKNPELRKTLCKNLK
jgi:4-amino-4-deoxy-L-arabinose transferase-like glycosyltransferase